MPFGSKENRILQNIDADIDLVFGDPELLALKVSFSKLQRYCESHGGFDLSIQNQVVNLSFVPTFPEALEKGDSIAPKVSMTGRLKENIVTFIMVETEDSSGVRIRDADESELVYSAWLDFIEQNY